MKYVVKDICPSCGGILDAIDEECYANEYPCRCDWWEDTAPQPDVQGGQVKNKKKK
jgi:hypothetical protein